MAHCVLHTHKEIQDLAKELNLHPGIVSSKVALWQEANNNFERFPTKDEIINPKRLDTSDKINAVFKEFKPRAINPVEFIEAFEKLPTNKRTPKYVLELIEKYDPFVEGSKYLELMKLFKQDDFTRIHLYDNIRNVYIENGFKEEYDNLSGDQQPYMVIFGTSDIYMGRDELINNTSDFGFMMVSSMLHEIVHAHTLDSLAKNNAFSEYINGLYDKLKNLKDLEGLYGITNNKEFVTELMTNPYFEEAVLQAEPNKINQNRIKQIFKEIWEAIVKLFTGNKSQFGKEVVQMKRIITDLMTSNIADFGNQYKNTVVENNDKVSPIIPDRLNIQDDSKQSQEYWDRIRKAKEAKKKKLAEKNKAQDQNKGENIKQFEKVYDEEGLSTEDSDKVDKIFKKYPQLSVVFSGNKSLYNKYLKSVFPNANEEFKGKLFFHGTKNPIEGGKFKISEKSLAKGLWFTKQLSYAKNVEGYSVETDNPTTYGVILNISNPKHFYNSSGAILVQTPSKFKEQYNETANDAAVFHHPESSDGKFTNNGGYNQVVVFDENQVHIIGDSADLKQAQEFIDKQSPKQAQTKRELSIQDIADNLDQYIDTANYMNQEERVTFAELIYDGYIEIKCSL